MKLTSIPASHNPPTTPIKINGNDKNIIIVCLNPLNKNTIITNIIKIAGGKATAIPSIDSSESSCSPPHSSEYPKGNFIASILGFIRASIASAFLPFLTSLMAEI